MTAGQRPNATRDVELLLGARDRRMTRAGQRSLWIIVGAALLSTLLVLIAEVGGN